MVMASKTIIVVEDDPFFLDLLRDAVESLGEHEVLSAEGGPAALEEFERRGGAVDLVVTDVVMPGLNGPELVARLAEARPAIKAIFISGLSERNLRQEGLLLPDFPFLHKPFDLDDLFATIQNLLSEETASNRSC